MKLILDIETRALPEAELLERFKPVFEAPSNYKDPVKIAEAIESAKAKWLDESTLKAERSRILVMGYTMDDGEHVEMLHGDEFHDILKPFIEILDNALKLVVCGFGLLNFDLPFIRRRCLLNGIAFPYYDASEKWNPWRFKTYDPMLDWQSGNRQDYISLDTLAKALGFEGKSDDWKECLKEYDTNPERLHNYCRHDVTTTAKVIGAMTR